VAGGNPLRRFHCARKKGRQISDIELLAIIGAGEDDPPPAGMVQ
jgi:hypothetical protein